MHTYATNSTANVRLMGWIAVGSVFAAMALEGPLGKLQAWMNETIGLDFGLGPISAMGLFWLMYVLFDKFLWRLRLLTRFLLVPDLNGTWEVEGLTTSKKGEMVAWPWAGEVVILQSWSEITILLKTKQSESRSISASLYNEPGRGHRLIYHYSNAPSCAEHELLRHCGLCDLTFSADRKTAQGTYFTDRDRVTVGTMKLTRKGNT